MSACDIAYSSLLKAEVLLWPKEFDNQHWMMKKPGAGGFTLRSKQGDSKAFVSLPNLAGDYGKSSHQMTDEELQNAFLETDAHETMHETLGNMGEDYDKPLHNEYPAMVAEYLQYARRPREQIPSNDKVSQLLDEGVDDREIAMQVAGQIAPMHQQVSPGHTYGGIARVVTGPPKESYDDIETGEPMDIAMRLLKYDRATEMYELAQEAMALGLADNWEDAMKIAEEEAESPSEFNPQFQQKNTSEPMEITHQLLKSDDERKKIEDYFEEKDWGGEVDETARDYYFTMGWPLTPFNKMSDRQVKLYSQMIFNYGTDGQPTVPSYWREPFQEAGHDYATEILMGDGMEHIPDDAYDELIRYHQHFNDAVEALPGGPNAQKNGVGWDEQWDLIAPQPGKPPATLTHPHVTAQQKMEADNPHWGWTDGYEGSFQEHYGIYHENRQFTPQTDDDTWQDNIETGEPMDIAMRLLKEEIDVSGQHAPRNDSRFWEVMRHYGTQDPNAVDVPFYPYSEELGEMTPQVDELIAGYGYKPYYFGGRYPMPDLGKKNYDTGHLAVFDPGEEATSFGGNEQFTANWRKLHELGHAQGLEDLNAEWGEGRRLGKVGARTPREMLRAVDWETRALENQRKLMEEVGLPVGQTEYNRDWNTTLGDAGFRAVTGQFTSPEGEGFVPHDEKISQDHAMNAVRTRAEELGLDMDETLRDKRGGARKVASEPMDIAYQLLKEKPFHGYNPNKHSKKGGLNAKGRATAKRETGANLKKPVTKKPSSLKPGGKAAGRRKSFCARMGGMKGATSKKGKLTPKGASLKRWNC